MVLIIDVIPAIGDDRTVIVPAVTFPMIPIDAAEIFAVHSNSPETGLNNTGASTGSKNKASVVRKVASNTPSEPVVDNVVPIGTVTAGLPVEKFLI